MTHLLRLGSWVSLRHRGGIDQKPFVRARVAANATASSRLAASPTEGGLDLVQLGLETIDEVLSVHFLGFVEVAADALTGSAKLVLWQV